MSKYLYICTYMCVYIYNLHCSLLLPKSRRLCRYSTFFLVKRNVQYNISSRIYSSLLRTYMTCLRTLEIYRKFHEVVCFSGICILIIWYLYLTKTWRISSSSPVHNMVLSIEQREGLPGGDEIRSLLFRLW